ncbi:MAG TPA: 1-acyl-sn-glycerol-3-phosphate acyltransferase [Verrucomicrobiae bacterium]|jgi:1-acyl-sn-glycerol-3-phosphate acyltransferase/nucleoside-diphosphate-sugar epimerase|nr:1-acyl-sn-glycerol-3-phosphate acyltransferase [Verrucomicrobiae bacterium]
MARVVLISRSDHALALAPALLPVLRRLKTTNQYDLVDPQAFASAETLEANATHVYLPSFADRHGMTPDLSEAERVLAQCARHRAGKIVLLSSALVYGTGPGRKTLVPEGYGVRTGGNRVASQWKALEDIARRYLQGHIPLVILRPTTVVPSQSVLGRRLVARATLTLAGCDPVVQLLSVSDLAEAICCAVENNVNGAFNVAPDGVVPLRAAICLAGGRRIGFPRTLQRLAVPADALEYLRYSWTVSNTKIKQDLGFLPRKSSLATLRELRSPSSTLEPTPEPAFDEFGMDNDYINSFSRTLFKFLCDHYWRIEVKGLDHVPAQGRAVLVGTHRGFMPWDGVMAVHLVAQKTERYIRFLAHPGLFKFPFIADFVAKLGAVPACQESADRVLESDGLLGVFPEGVAGAFAVCRNAYKLRRFGRDAFVKTALRHRTPIIPFVTMGSAETFPIFATIKSRRWTRYSDWPCIPISTFPLLPVPLPAKWHMRFLSPIHVEKQYPPEADQDAAVVKAISLEVSTQMQRALDEMAGRRRSIFFGSVFGDEAGS